MNKALSKGDVVNVNLGSPPNEIKGHEQALLRPCIVLKAMHQLELAIVIPLTTKTTKQSLFTIVKIPKGTAGLSADSYALCHQILTISFDRIEGIRGKLENKDLLKIHTVLIDTLDIQ